MPVNTKHSLYHEYLSLWEKCRDAIAGQEAIKARSNGTAYLPQLSGQDYLAYNAYLKRAQYINFTARTIETAMGQLFRKNPVIDGIDEDLLKNVTQTGKSFSNFSRMIASEIIAVNRVGILVDFNDMTGNPFLTSYNAENTINYQTGVVDGQIVLTRVVLEGKVDTDSDDIYSPGSREIWTDIYIDDNGYYSVDTYAREKDSNKFVKTGDTVQPIFRGEKMRFLPFYIISTDGISPDYIKPTILDFVNVNLGHYVNSADYENMIHWTGAKTIVTKGFTGETIPVGGSFDVGQDGDAFFLEASSDSGLKDAMQKKEEQMAALGSAIISGKGRYVASAETARVTASGEYATLADIANALSNSMSEIMTFYNAWAGSDETVVIQYNTDYDNTEIDNGKLIELMGAVQSGLMSYETFFYNLKKYEVYPEGLDVESEKKMISNDMKNKIVSLDNAIASDMVNNEA